MATLREASKAYVDLQIEKIRRDGPAPRLSPAKYRRLIDDVYSMTIKARAEVRKRINEAHQNAGQSCNTGSKSEFLVGGRRI